MWNEITTWISAFFDKPIVISGVSLGTIGGIILVIISKSNFGKSAISKVNEQCKLIKDQFLETITQVDSFKADLSNQMSQYTQVLDSKVEFIQREKKELETLVLALAENSHNEKVKESVAEYFAKKNQFEAQVGIRVDEAKTQFEIYNKALDDKYNEIIKLLNERVEGYEEIKCEEEETKI